MANVMVELCFDIFLKTYATLPYQHVSDQTYHYYFMYSFTICLTIFLPSLQLTHRNGRATEVTAMASITSILVEMKKHYLRQTHSSPREGIRFN